MPTPDDTTLQQHELLRELALLGNETAREYFHQLHKIQARDFMQAHRAASPAERRALARAIAEQRVQAFSTPTTAPPPAASLSDLTFGAASADQPGPVAGLLSGMALLPTGVIEGAAALFGAEQTAQAARDARLAMAQTAGAHPITSTVGGALSFVPFLGMSAVGAPIAVPAAALGTAEAFRTYGEGRHDYGLTPAEAGGRALLHGALLGGTTAWSPVSRYLTTLGDAATGAAASVPRAFGLPLGQARTVADAERILATGGAPMAVARPIAASAADAGIAGLATETAAGGVDTMLGAALGQAALQHAGQERMTGAYRYLPEMMLGGALVGVAGIPASVRQQRFAAQAAAQRPELVRQLHDTPVDPRLQPTDTSDVPALTMALREPSSTMAPVAELAQVLRARHEANAAVEQAAQHVAQHLDRLRRADPLVAQQLGAPDTFTSRPFQELKQLTEQLPQVADALAPLLPDVQQTWHYHQQRLPQLVAEPLQRLDPAALAAAREPLQRLRAEQHAIDQQLAMLQTPPGLDWERLRMKHADQPAGMAGAIRHAQQYTQARQQPPLEPPRRLPPDELARLERDRAQLPAAADVATLRHELQQLREQLRQEREAARRAQEQGQPYDPARLRDLETRIAEQKQLVRFAVDELQQQVRAVGSAPTSAVGRQYLPEREQLRRALADTIAERTPAPTEAFVRLDDHIRQRVEAALQQETDPTTAAELRAAHQAFRAELQQLRQQAAQANDPTPIIRTARRQALEVLRRVAEREHARREEQRLAPVREQREQVRQQQAERDAAYQQQYAAYQERQARIQQIKSEFDRTFAQMEREAQVRTLEAQLPELQQRIIALIQNPKAEPGGAQTREQLRRTARRIRAEVAAHRQQHPTFPASLDEYVRRLETPEQRGDWITAARAYVTEQVDPQIQQLSAQIESTIDALVSSAHRSQAELQPIADQLLSLMTQREHLQLLRQQLLKAARGLEREAGKTGIAWPVEPSPPDPLVVPPEPTPEPYAVPPAEQRRTTPLSEAGQAELRRLIRELPSDAQPLPLPLPEPDAQTPRGARQGKDSPPPLPAAADTARSERSARSAFTIAPAPTPPDASAPTLSRVDAQPLVDVERVPDAGRPAAALLGNSQLPLFADPAYHHEDQAAAKAVPLYQGNKSRLVPLVRTIIRTLPETVRQQTTMLYEPFGGSGAYGLALADLFPNVKRILLHELKPQRVETLKVLFERGDELVQYARKLPSDLRDALILELTAHVLSRTGAKLSRHQLGNVLRTYLTSHEQQLDPLAKALLDHAAEYGANSFGTSYGPMIKPFDRSQPIEPQVAQRLDYLLNQVVTTQLEPLVERINAFRARGGTIDIVQQDSYTTLPDFSGERPFVLVDPPYFHTLGYLGGTRKTPLSVYQQTRDLLVRLAEHDLPYIYHDSAWMLHEPSLRELPSSTIAAATETLRGIKAVTPRLTATPSGIPTPDRREVLGVRLPGDPVAATAPRPASAPPAQATPAAPIPDAAQVRHQLRQLTQRLTARFGMRVQQIIDHPTQPNGIRLVLDRSQGLSVDLVPLDTTYDAILNDAALLTNWVESVLAREANPRLGLKRLSTSSIAVGLTQLSNELDQLAAKPKMGADAVVQLFRRHLKQHRPQLLSLLQRHPPVGGLVVHRDGPIGTLRAVIKLADVANGTAALDEEVAQLVWRFLTADERRQLLDAYAPPLQKQRLRGVALNSIAAEEVGAQILTRLEGLVRVRHDEYRPALLNRAVAGLLRVLPFAKAWARARADALMREPIIPGGTLLAMIRDGSIYERPYTPPLTDTTQPMEAFATRATPQALEPYEPYELLQRVKREAPPIRAFGSPDREVPRDPAAGLAKLVRRVNEPEPETVDQWIAEAHAILNDPKRFQAMLAKHELGETLSASEQRALLELVSRRFRDALTMRDDRAAERALVDAVQWAETYNEAGTRAARALRSRWGDLDTAEGRGQWIKSITFQMSKAWRDKLAKAKTANERHAIRAAWAQGRARLYRRVLERYGIDLLDDQLGAYMDRGMAFATARIIADEAALLGVDQPGVGEAWWRLWPSYVTGNLISLSGLAANITGAAIFKTKNTLREWVIDPLLAKTVKHQDVSTLVAANIAAMGSWAAINALASNRLGRGWLRGRWLSEDISENPAIGEPMASSEGRRDPWITIGEDIGRRLGGERGAQRGRTWGGIIRMLAGPAREGVIVLDEFLWQHVYTREVIRQLVMRERTPIQLDRLAELLDNIPDEIVTIAAAKADELTLRNQPVTEVFRGINHILDAVTMSRSFYGSDSVAAKLWHGVATTILPFRRALVNLSEHAVRIADPTQAIKGVLAVRQARKAVAGDLDVPPQALVAKASEHFANALLGLGVYAIAAFIEAPLTLEEQSEPMRRRTLETARQVRELPGGIAISRLEPISPAALTAKATAQVVRDWERHDLETAVAKYLSRIANVNLNRTLMTGISSLMGKEFDDVTGEPKSFLLKTLENISDVSAPGRPYIISTRILTDERPHTAVDTGPFGVTYGPRKRARDFFGQEAEFRHQNPLMRLFFGGHREEDPEAIKWARRLDQANEELIAHRRSLTPEERDKLPNPWDIPYFARTIRRNNVKYVMNEEEYEQAKSVLGAEFRKNLQRLEATGRWRDDADMLYRIKLIRAAALKAHATARRHGLRLVRQRLGGQAGQGPDFDIPTVNVPDVDVPDMPVSVEF